MSIFSINSTPTNFINAVRCVLSEIAATVLEVRLVGRNKCPWAKYVTAAGRNCATFISPKKFVGYHFQFQTNKAICTDLETGTQYTINLNPVVCSCATPNCQHLKAVQNQPEFVAKTSILQAPMLGYGDIVEIVGERHGDEFIWEQGKVIDVLADGWINVQIQRKVLMYQPDDVVLVKKAPPRPKTSTSSYQAVKHIVSWSPYRAIRA